MNSNAQYTSAPGVNDFAVRAEMIRVLFGSAAAALSNVPIVIIAAVVVWPIYPVWVILTWTGVSITVSAFRLALWHQFRRRQPDAASLTRWARAFTFASAVTGCLWGLLAFTVFVTPDPVYAVFAAFVLGGLSAGSATYSSPYLPSFYGFVFPAVLPIVAALLIRGTMIPDSMGLMLLAFVVVLTLLARANNRRLADYIRMKVAQEVLNKDLQKLTFDLTKEVGERQKIAVELEKSSERFRAIGEHALDAIIISDSKGEAVYWNAAAERTFGYRADEIVGRNVHEMLAPERHRRKAIKRYAHFARTGEGDALGKTVRLDALRKDGSEFPLELALSAMKLGGDRYALGIGRDVSERVRAATLLSEREAELREAQRVAHVGSWSYDPLTDASRWSEELYRIFGLDPRLPAPDPAEYAKRLTPESVAAMAAAMNVCAESGKSFEIDLELKRPDHHAGWVSMRGEARRDTDGKVLLSGTIQDISARKCAEDLVREGEAMFRSVVEQNMSGTAMLAEDATIAYLNPRAVEMLGVGDASAAIGKPVVDFIADADKSVAAEAMQALFGGQRDSVEVAVRLRRPDNETLDVLAQATIGTYRQRRVIFTVIVDITERRRTEHEILKLNEQMAATVAVLRRREHEQTEIAKLSDLLQSCATTTEAYPIISAAAKLVFPQTSGALARVEKGLRELTRVAVWGAEHATLPEFLVDDCWALRTGQRREVAGPKGPVQCRHFSPSPRGPYVCLPLVVQGETRGLLSLSLGEGGVIDDDLRQTLQSFGDVVKLSLVNINHRELLGQQALRDQLTSLFNRRYLAETLPREVRRAQRSGSALTVAMLDIDFFKHFNDMHGHDAGDLVLSELGQILQESLRAGDIACRYGGEEFLLVLLDCDLAAARVRLTQICLKVRRNTLMFRGQKLSTVTLSVGLATSSETLPDGESLITAADKAMYLAKTNGRDRIEDFLTPKFGDAELALTTFVPA
jgi:diguanylate cyclase (GGDEF)-like protein/PAS domain S-box-containing protein